MDPAVDPKYLGALLGAALTAVLGFFGIRRGFRRDNEDRVGSRAKVDIIDRQQEIIDATYKALEASREETTYLRQTVQHLTTEVQRLTSRIDLLETQLRDLGVDPK